MRMVHGTRFDRRRRGAGCLDQSEKRAITASAWLFYGATRSRLALRERDRTVWERMHALGLEFLGPQAPHGRSSESASADVPADTKNVPTVYYQGRGPEVSLISASI